MGRGPKQQAPAQDIAGGLWGTRDKTGKHAENRIVWDVRHRRRVLDSQVAEDVKLHSHGCRIVGARTS